MKTDSELLARLGGRLREDLGTPLDETRRRAQREAVALLVTRRPLPRRHLALGLAVAAGLAAAATGIAAYFALRAAPGSRPVAGDARPTVAEGTWIEAPPHDSVSVRLADGSVVDCAPGTLLRVERSRTDEVALAVEHGLVHAEVPERTPARWAIHAGPYEVRVTGTVFSCGWTPESVRLEVAVDRGAVRVHGPGLDPDGTPLNAGQRLALERNDQPPLRPAAAPRAPAARAGSADAEVGRAEEPAPTEPPPPLAPPAAETRSSTSPGASTGGVRRDWRSLAEAGRYAEALAAAEAAGFDSLVATLGAADLWRLAGAARYARDGRRAVAALEAYRRRFPAGPQAGTAAFLLGRAEAELNGNPGRAALWFGSYLLEHPDGPLAEEALGRLIDAQLKSGNRPAARDAARTYLAKHPDGVFRELAAAALSR